MKITKDEIETLKAAKKIVWDLGRVTDWKSTLDYDTRKAFDSLADVIKQVEE